MVLVVVVEVEVVIDQGILVSWWRPILSSLEGGVFLVCFEVFR